MADVHTIKNFIIEGKHGRPLLADVHIPVGEGPFPAVIFSHGFKGFKDWGPFNLIANTFADSGIVFVKVNFGFNGTTPQSPYDFVDLNAFGNNNFSKEIDDLDSTLNWLFGNLNITKVDHNDISLIGHSRGGGISILKGNEDSRIKKIAGWASVAGFDRHISKSDIHEWKKSGVYYVENARTNQMMPLYLQIYDDFMHNHRRFNIAEVIRNIDKKVFLAHARNDDTIPFDQILELHNLNPFQTILLEMTSGGHTFDTAHPFTDSFLPESMQSVVNETIKFIKKSN